MILHGDALASLRTLPENSVDCCVTSPPYWKLRDYGAVGQLGLEDTPAEWVANLVAVFAEVRRVLAPWGTLWLNVGDKYMSDGGSGHQGNANSCRAHRRHTQRNLATAVPATFGLKTKDLCLLPERLILALQQDGWWVRQRCVWHKQSPMPEATKDRPTTDFEHVWMLTKSADYFFDAYAVMEETTGGAHSRGTGITPKGSRTRSGSGTRNNDSFGSAVRELVSSRNLRSVWKLKQSPFVDEKCLACGAYYDGREKKLLQRTADYKLICACGRSDSWLAHFATFPPSLPDLCIRASTSAAGNCAWCGVPIERMVRRARVGDWHPDPEHKHEPGAVSRNVFKTVHGDRKRQVNENTRAARGAKLPHDNPFPGPVHLGWKACCPGAAGATRPAVVLDPFGGAMTTALAADRLGRDSVSIELNADYVALGTERIRRDRLKREVRLSEEKGNR